MERRYLRRSTPGVSEQGALNGRAIAYDQWTMIGKAPWGFREKVNPKASNKSVNDGDMVLLDNHDTARPIARQSAGTLILRNNGDALDWDTSNLPDTSYVRDAIANAKAGNYGGCSFGFEVVRDKWSVGDDGIDEREILEAKIHEISICTFPAYDQTSVSARDEFESAMEARTRFYEHELRAKYSAEQLKEMLAKGQAFKNANGEPSYPIADADDLSNAIRAVGRGGADHNAIRKYIIGRAKALGLSKEIPDSWNADGSVGESKSAPEVTVTGDDYTDMASRLITMFNELPDDQRSLVTSAIKRDDPDGHEYHAIDQAVQLLSAKPPNVSGALAVLKANQKTRSTGDAVETSDEPVTSTRDDIGRALRMRMATHLITPVEE